MLRSGPPFDASFLVGYALFLCSWNIQLPYTGRLEFYSNVQRVDDLLLCRLFALLSFCFYDSHIFAYFK